MMQRKLLLQLKKGYRNVYKLFKTTKKMNKRKKNEGSF